MAPAKRGDSIDESKTAPKKRAPADAPGIGSPLKRVKAAIRVRATRAEVVLSSVEAFRTHVLNEVASADGGLKTNVVVTGTLLWKSEHQFGDKKLVRLHVTDTHPEDSLDELTELEELYGSSDENRSVIDGVLITATVFGERLDSPNLPKSGDKIRIVNSRKRLVYDGTKCQLVARVTDITIE